MEYLSTRGNNERKSAAQSIIQGIAKDKGLFVPSEIPKLPFAVADMVDAKYKEVAKQIIGAFFTDYTSQELDVCVSGAYDEKFEKKEIAPIIDACGTCFLELYHGKTSAFKDMALSILPHLLTTAIKKEGETKKICILTATSGDTGKAALEGFADVEGTEIFVFYPKNGVSAVQEKQMLTQEGNNTHVFAIEGNFDQAQTGVKNIFNDKDVADKLDKMNCKLSSANSINIGRLVPQVAYYVYAYLKMVEMGEIAVGDEINVAVPTGNFGNILAAYYAKEMGIPIHKFICASNENKVLTDFINTGVYYIDREFYLTNSPSMDILISSNLERLLYHLAKDKTEVAILMKELEEEKQYQVSEELKEAMKDFYGGYADQEETLETIKSAFEDEGYLMDTHTAVAYKVYSEYKRETGDDRPTVIVSTASPYKFAKDVAKAIGLNPCDNEFQYLDEIYQKTGVSIPKNLADLEDKKELHNNVIAVEAMKDSVFNKLTE